LSFFSLIILFEMSEFAVELKDKGNELFKSADYPGAKGFYTQALAKCESSDKEIRATILSNRAACNLKLGDFKSSIEDCSSALVINPLLVKSLFRRAQAYEGLAEYGKAVQDLSALLHYEPNNAPAVALMRKMKELVLKEQSNSSEVKSIFEMIRKDNSKLTTGLGSLVGLCYEDRNHAMDFFRKGGITWICDVINSHLTSVSSTSDPNRSVCSDALVAAVRVLSAASNHKSFVLAAIDVEKEVPSIFDARNNVFVGSTRILALVPSDFGTDTAAAAAPQRISFASLCGLLTVLSNTAALTPILLLILNILKSFPMTVVASPSKAAASGEGGGGGEVYSIRKFAGHALLTGLRHALCINNSDSFGGVTDTICAFLSDSPDYYNSVTKEVDTRMESMEARKQRHRSEQLVKTRSLNHCTWALECGLLGQLVINLDHDNATVRQASAACVGKFVNFYDNVDKLKEVFSQHLHSFREELGGRYDMGPVGAGDGNGEGEEEKRVVELPDIDVPAVALTVPLCRLRAALEAALLIAHPDLGTWALERPGGVAQLLFLVGTQDPRCQEVAAEVICLAAAMESGAALLTAVISSGTLTTLMHAPSPGIRAAAASAVTKLSIKAKALSEDSAEVSQILNTAISVLKIANSPNSLITSASDAANSSNLVSFSALDEVSHDREKVKKTESEALAKKKKAVASSKENSHGVTMTAVERAIESLAAMSGKSYIKEELVHGSYR
jgi:hypothetical protein